MRWTSVTDRPRGAVILAVVALTVCACGTARDDRNAGTPGPLPVVPGPTVPAEPGRTLEVLPPPPPVAWADDGERLAVTTSGSSSCPLGPTGVEVVGTQEVRVDVAFLFPDRDPCTADIAPTTTEIEVPDGISADEPLTVILEAESGVQERVILLPAGR